MVWNIQLEFYPDGTLCVEGKKWFVILEADTGQELYRGTSGPEGIRVLDTVSGDEVFSHPLTNAPGMPFFVEYTPAGLQILIYSQEESNAIGDLTVFDLRTAQRVIAFRWQRGTESWYALDRIEYSPDGKLMALTPTVGSFEVWDLASEQRLATLSGMPPVSIDSILFNPDNSTLLVHGEDGTIKVWDIGVEKEIFSLTGTEAYFSADGQKLVVTGANRQVSVWHILSQHELYHFLCNPLQISSALSSDGMQLASGGSDGAIHLCEVAPDYEAQVWVAEHLLVDFGYAPEPGLLAVAEVDNVIHFFDAETGKAYKDHPMPEGANLIAFALAPNGIAFQTLEASYSVRTDRTFISRVWETVSGWEISRQGATDARVEEQSSRGPAHPDGTRGVLLEGVWAMELSLYDTKIMSPLLWQDWVPFEAGAYSPDGSRLALSKIDGRIGLFDAKTFTQLMTATLEGGQTALVFDPGGDYLAVGNQRGGVSILDMESGEILVKLPDQAAAINLLDYSPDGKLLATGTADGVVRLWEAETGQELLELVRYESTINLLAFNQDGSRVISGSQDGVARSSVVDLVDLLSLASQRVQREFSPQELVRYRIETAEGDLFEFPEQAAPAAHTIELAPFPIPSRNEVHLPSQPSAPISADNVTQIQELGWAEVEFTGTDTTPLISPDGRVFTTTGLSMLRTLYDFATLQPIWQQRINHLIDALNFSPDGAYLATASEDGFIHLLRVADGKELTAFAGHTTVILGLEFSPDGSLLASGAQDDLILLYSIPDGALVGTLQQESYGKGIAGLAFSPDGTLLASGSGDGKVRFWGLKSRQVVLEFQASLGAAGPISFSPDGVYITTGDSSSLDGSRVWRVADGSKVFEIPEGGYPFFFLEGSMLETRKIFFDENNHNQLSTRYYFWDAKDGTLLHSFVQLGLALGGFTTPDRKFYVTFTWDCRMHLYGVP